MDEQQLQQQIVQLVQAAMQGDQQATQQIQQIMQAAQQGDQQAVQITQMIQQVAQQMQQQQVQAARFGAKLNYIKQLKGQCPEGYKMEYYKQGGPLCKRCMKVHQDGGEVKQTPNTVAEQFKMEAAKCGKKMNKKENGGAVETEKCGGKPKLKKKAQGGPMNNSIKRNKNQIDRNNTNKNVINGTVQTGKSSFDSTKTQLPSRKADGMQTPNGLQKQGEHPNNVLIPKKPVKKNLGGGTMQENVTPASRADAQTLRRLNQKSVARVLNDNQSVGTVNWSDGTSTTVNNSNNTVTGRDGRTYGYGTFQGDSIYNSDIAAPMRFQRQSGKPAQINDRTREITQSINSRWKPIQ